MIGGRNNQGKTSVIDALAWTLGGGKFKPSQAQRADSVIPLFLSVKLSNGLIVERKGKNSALKVIDPEGNKGGQQLLNSFVETFALDLPKFMDSTNKEKAEILLRIIGVRDKELVCRERICALEVWCECFGGDIRYMKKSDAREINDILSGIEGWKRVEKTERFGKDYGVQRGYMKV